MNQQPDRIARLLQLSLEARIPTSRPRSTHLWADALSVAVGDRDCRCGGARMAARQGRGYEIAGLKGSAAAVPGHRRCHLAEDARGTLTEIRNIQRILDDTSRRGAAFRATPLRPRIHNRRP